MYLYSWVQTNYRVLIYRVCLISLYTWFFDDFGSVIRNLEKFDGRTDGSFTAFRFIELLTFCRSIFWTRSFSWSWTKKESLVHIPFTSIFKKHLQVLRVLHTHLAILFANCFSADGILHPRQLLLVCLSR